MTMFIGLRLGKRNVGFSVRSLGCNVRSLGDSNFLLYGAQSLLPKTLGIKGVISVVDVGWLVEGLEFGFRAQGVHRIPYRVSDN